MKHQRVKEIAERCGLKLKTDDDLDQNIYEFAEQLMTNVHQNYISKLEKHIEIIVNQINKLDVQEKDMGTLVTLRNICKNITNPQILPLNLSQFVDGDVKQSQSDWVNHPSHYTSDPSGVECIEITRHRNFNIGNAIKYLWRAGLKSETTHVEDLEKAIWYIQDEIKRLTTK